LSLALTRLVAFLDDDDWWRAQFVERCLAALSGGPSTTGVFTDVEIRSADGERFVTANLGSAKDCLHRNGGFMGQNALFLTDCVRAVGGFDPGLRALQDRDLQLRMLRAGATFGVVNEPLAIVDQSHSPQRISTSAARADGALQFYRKWAHHASTPIRLRMLMRTLIAQQTASSAARRFVGKTALRTYRSVTWINTGRKRQASLE
jgi:hypothetical protein